MMMNVGVNPVEMMTMILILVNIGKIFHILSNVFIVQRINNLKVQISFIQSFETRMFSSFLENQFSDDIIKAKDYVKKLTDLNPQILFNRFESIVLEYVREIRNQVFERFHTCAKTSHDVQLFISFLLDEYQMFIQAATNVSMIISYLVIFISSSSCFSIGYLGGQLHQIISFNVVIV